jgi:hypothetical protein
MATSGTTRKICGVKRKASLMNPEMMVVINEPSSPSAYKPHGLIKEDDQEN